MSEEIIDTEFEEIIEEKNEAERIIDRGIVMFHDEEGALSYKTIGNVGLQDMSFYLRYLQNLEQFQWDKNFKEEAGEADA